MGKAAKWKDIIFIMNKLKILAVDDESRMRKLVKDFLVKQNYEVLEAGDGSEALDIFSKIRILH